MVGRRVTLHTLLQVSTLNSFFTTITLNLNEIVQLLREREREGGKERERVKRGYNNLVCKLAEDEYIICVSDAGP